MIPAPLIVMMTDFGTEHWYDAAMKGEILRRAPDARILDLSHDVPRQSVKQGCFLLHCAVDSFPAKTIFLCVIDPGVGAERRSIVGWVGDFGYVGPDNGLITPLLDRAGGKFELHEIQSPTFRNKNVSATFHGRDVFAPAAARLLLGDDPRMAGRRIEDPMRLPPIWAAEEENMLKGEVMLVDHFGNAITNIHGARFLGLTDGKQFTIEIGNLTFKQICRTYSDVKVGEPFCHWGSSGFLEIAVNFGSAAEKYHLSIGDPIVARF